MIVRGPWVPRLAAEWASPSESTRSFPRKLDKCQHTVQLDLRVQVLSGTSGGAPLS